jgi:glutamine amidotransferase
MTGRVSGRRVGLIDYQAGNLQSIGNAFEHLDAGVTRVHRFADLEGCTHLVLPGVGAFGFCADRLHASGLLALVEDWVFRQERPLLGICVGMQLMADASEESPEAHGLGWIGGRVQLIAAEDRAVRVPHVGWNTIAFEETCGEFGVGSEADFYFDHSFAYAEPLHGSRVASCQHGERFSAVVRRRNILAVQFHPEKSQAAGLRLLRGFLAS